MEPQEAEILARAFDRGGDRGGDLRRVPLELAREHVGAKQEISGIPDAALLDVAARRGRGRLLDEPLHLADSLAERGAATDVAVAGFRLARRDAEGGDVAGFGRLARRPAGGGKKVGS